MSLTLVTGCMFSSKTSYLIKEINRYRSISYPVLVVNTIQDTRYGQNSIINHDRVSEHAIGLMNLGDIFKLKEYINAKVVIVEEGNFFKDLVENVKTMVDKDGKHLIVSGLNGNYLREPFGSYNLLFALADEIIHLKAYCKKCNDTTPAIFTLRIVNNKEETLVGGSDSYMPVCRKHYLEHCN
jgi:thymidine kinase